MSSHAKPQHLFATMLACVQAATTAVLGSGADVSRIVVEPPRDPTHGDMATNAAMVLAKDAGKKPRELAESIAAKLRGDGVACRCERRSFADCGGAAPRSNARRYGH